MPYTLPTAEQFQARFPVFADADTGLITELIKEASQSVGTDWVEDDYQPAIQYLAAHLLATEQSAEGGQVDVGSIGAGSVKSESFGGMSISYGADSGATTKYDASGLGTTVYGRRYLDILARNVPAVLVV